MNASSPPELPGRTLGEFLVKDKIGQGGFGAIYRAVQPALDREAVIKVLHTRLRTDDQATQRFLREARFASRLDHPFAAHIYAFGAEPDGLLWIAMEMVRGTPLDRLVRTQGTLDVARFLPLFERICEVVQAAHDEGIIHRDLKPANVMVVSRAGRLSPKLLDFGIAKALEHPTAATKPRARSADEAPATPDLANTLTEDRTDPNHSLTSDGAAMGSPFYMAPEQWLDAATIDARADIYALGVVAFETLMGKVPFGGSSAREIAMAHARNPVPPLRPDLPASLAEVLSRAMAKQPQDRYASAVELAAAFRAASGLAAAPIALPRLEEIVQADALASLPQPLAEAVAALDAARNPHHLRDAIILLLRVATRVLGLLSVVARTRLGPIGSQDSTNARELLVALYRRALDDEEWLVLAAELARPHAANPDAHPLPELVRLLVEPDGASAAGARRLAGLITLAGESAGSEAALGDRLVALMPELSALLRGLLWLADYPLVLPLAGGVGESWMGVRRPARATVLLRSAGTTPGSLALLGAGGAPILSLAPLWQVAAPTPGAPLELFLFEGRGLRGARLVAMPQSFEHHDEEIWGWLRGQLPESLDLADSTSTGEASPYRGLAAFTAADAELFVGREHLVDVVVNRLRATPLVAVVGPSGTGKSSLVQAGVVPALPERWRVVTVRPGGAPFAALAARLAAAGIELRDPDALGEVLRAEAARGGPLLLVVDQLEELVTLCRDDAERDRFAAALAGAARATEDPVRVLVTLRDDFLVRAESIAALRGRLGAGLQLVTTPAAADLVRILVEPARRRGYEFEDAAMPEEMVREVADQPGALALLSFTAARLWNRRDRHFRLLPQKAYAQMGGVGGALAQHAEETLEALPLDKRRLVREAFRHLVTAEGTRAVMRRAELAELLAGADDVVEHLVGARLLVASEGESGEDRIEVIHEALLSAWPRLVDWRRQDAENARLRDELRAAARQWHERERPAALLWRDEMLADLGRWRARSQPSLTELERGFADASAAEAEAGRRRRRRALAGLILGLSTGLVLLLWQNAQVRAKGSEAEAQRQIAQREGARAEVSAADSKRALAQQLRDQGEKLVADGDPVAGLAYLVEVLAMGEDDRPLRVLLAAALRASALPRRDLGTFPSEAATLALAGDDSMLAVGDDAGVVRIFSAAGELVREIPGPPGTVRAIAFDGANRIWSLGADGTLRAWAAAGGDARSAFPIDPGGNVCLAISRDGRTILAAAGERARAFDTETGHAVAAFAARPQFANSCAVSSDGRTFAIAGYKAVWISRAGAPAHQRELHADAVDSLAFAPAGSRLLTTSRDGTAAITDTASASPPLTLWHRGWVQRGLWSPDGKLVLTISSDGFQVWDAVSGRQTQARITSDPMRWMAMDGAGQRVVTAGIDDDIEIWDAATARPIGVVDAPGVNAIALTRDGRVLLGRSASGQLSRWELDGASGLLVSKQADPSGVMSVRFAGRDTLVTAAFDGPVDLWDAETMAHRRRFKGPPGQDAVVSGDGRFVAAAGQGEAMAWSAEGGKPVWRLPTEGRLARSVAFTPDDKALLVAARNRVSFFATADWHQLSEIELPADVLAAAPDVTGGLFAASTRRGEILVVDRGTATTRVRIQGPPGASASAALSPDGTRLVSAHDDSTARLWDASSGKELAVLRGHGDSLYWADFSPDGSVIGTVAKDGTARLWDAARAEPLLVIPAHATALGRASFDPTSTRLAISTEDGWVEVWNIAPTDEPLERLAKHARCRLDTTSHLTCR